MKVKIQQFLYGKNHSWAIVGKAIGRELLKKNHQVDFISTDGIKEKYLPEDLKPYVKNAPDGSYDMQISYTAPINWSSYLNSGGNRNRFAIWNYEYRGVNLLPGFAKNYKYVDKILPSSNFSKDVFLDMGVPEEKLVVVPHGINLEEFDTDKKYELKTKKKYKILLNIAQPHKRKNIPGALKAFGKAFTKDDDVCLVAKVSIDNKSDQQFNVDFYKLFETFKRKYKNHAEVELITTYIPNITELYNACDINFSATHTECWHLPSLEALAAGLINIVPNYGGLLDFCNDKNSLLIDGRNVRCPRDHQYWTSSPYAYHFQIDIDDAAQKLKKAVENYDKLYREFYPNMKSTAEKFTWKNAVSQIIQLC